jgi:bis(5'-nucleosidyl)-tetraphosphatase
MKREFSAGSIVYYIENEKAPDYLVLYYGANHWDFPKGKLEPGETNEMAAVREVKEETGLDIILNKGFEYQISYKFRMGDELVSKQVVFFTSRVETKNVVISHEHSGFVWLPYEKMRQILTYDNSVKLLDSAHAFVVKLHKIE